MKTYIIRTSNPLEELEEQQNIATEIHERLIIPHELALKEFEADCKRQFKIIEEGEEEKRERRHTALVKSEEQYKKNYMEELQVLNALTKQITHIIAAEIANRRPLKVLCDYKSVLFTIPIRYKN
jgi:hypothetical protein